ncbi:hypothetical protein [Microbacterium trichothecenolyticum]|uniref:Uncharacterized protein n=1 Tax=Microbacterium trichothecenolyticum TaxID=69370 RepID=A0ABU0TXR4_MICTR|nr:hypothetical protein [Microbacterium trichothecenolyticum]MDQ1124436.1 hypothetical protein [Microbacterium trichothecenolyticum]
MPGEYGWQRVRVGNATISIAEDEPIALVRCPDESERVATWPDLDLGARATGMTLLCTSTGVWVVYRPQEALDETIARGRSAAVHVGLDASLGIAESLGDAQLIGATVHGLWFRDPAASSDPDRTDAWLSDDVRIRSVDGAEHRMLVDWRIAWVIDAGTSDACVAVHTEPPRRSRRGWEYATAEIVLPSGALPGELRTQGSSLHPVNDSEMMATMRALLPQRVPRASGDARASWQPATIRAADIAAAVDAVTHEFADLERYWTDPSGKSGPLVGGLHEPRVDVHGEWPDTRVEVSFRHPYFTDGRLRRVLRVFDPAGRFAPPLYASVHLMEDLATGRLPPIETAIDGVLDF